MVQFIKTKVQAHKMYCVLRILKRFTCQGIHINCISCANEHVGTQPGYENLVTYIREIYIYVCMYVYICILYIRIFYIYTHTHIYVCKYIHTYIHVYIYIIIYISSIRSVLVLLCT
jgi:hypothetical protein